MTNAACKQCGLTTHLVDDWVEGNVTCTNCGLVASSCLIDDRPEWREFEDGSGKEMNRVGIVYNPESTELGTDINGGGRLRQIHYEAMMQDAGVRHERRKDDKCKEVQDLCRRLSLPAPVVTNCKKLVGLVYDRHMCRGRNPQAVFTAVVYMVCKIHGQARSLKELCNIVSNVTPRQVGDCFQVIKDSRIHKHLRMTGLTSGCAVTENHRNHETTMNRMLACVKQHPDMIGFTKMCHDVMQRVVHMGLLQGHTSATLVTSVIAVSDKHHQGLNGDGPYVSVDDLATAAQISAGTIRGAHKLLEQEHERLFDGSGNNHTSAI